MMLGCRKTHKNSGFWHLCANYIEESLGQRGIASGMGYPQIARNIANYAEIPKNRAMTIARTESHRIQCKATSDAQFEAKKKGADVVKQWDAVLDGDTRLNHRQLDGQIRELETLKERAAYFGLDKTKDFEDYEKKYLKATETLKNRKIVV